MPLLLLILATSWLLLSLVLRCVFFSLLPSASLLLEMPSRGSRNRSERALLRVLEEVKDYRHDRADLSVWEGKEHELCDGSML